ncbi:MAG: dihydroorotase [Bacillota bacterium]
MNSLLLKGARVIDPSQQLDQAMDILIVEGKIAAVGVDLVEESAEIIDLSGRVVTPGLIDMHVHLREPGQEYKEDIASGSRAAVRGGFTAIACMPNTNPVIDNRSQVEFIFARAREAGMARVYPIAALTKGQLGQELTEMGELKSCGVVALSDDGKNVSNAEVMRNAMEYASMFNLPVISHCEESSLAEGRVMHLGAVSTRLGLRGIPAAAEEVIVARDILLAELTGARLHLAHLSSAGSVRLLRDAKARGVKVTAEVTPHHLAVTDEQVATSCYDTNTKVNPPLRTEADRQALIAALCDGTIDAIATDHAPHHRDDKLVEYDLAAFGISGLETAVPLLLDRLVRTGDVPLATLIARLTCGPAKILGLSSGIQLGAPADLTVLDLGVTKTVNPDVFASKGRNTPFAGWELTGWPTMTIVDGVVVKA